MEFRSISKCVKDVSSVEPINIFAAAAEVISHELSLDHYKLHLSAVVIKYIGETETNLARIFQEAETSNAILLFDEADAFFDYRSEVSSTQDRFAILKINYILQKMEEKEGVVILPTNHRQDMDEAFTRRIKIIDDFPFPDALRRLKVWKTHPRKKRR